MSEPRKYKITIDKDAVREFLANPVAEATQRSYDEICKVIMAVLVRHFNKYTNDFDELKSIAWMYICERHPHYNPEYDAYNYVYTNARGAVCNYFAKRRIELSDCFEDLPKGVDANECHIEQSVVEKYGEYLLGDKKFKYVPVEEQDSAELIVELLVGMTPRNIKQSVIYAVNTLTNYIKNVRS